MLLLQIRIKSRSVLHLDNISRGALQSNSQRFVAHHTNTGELSGGCNGAVTGGGQQDLGIGLIGAMYPSDKATWNPDRTESRPGGHQSR